MDLGRPRPSVYGIIVTRLCNSILLKLCHFLCQLQGNASTTVPFIIRVALAATGTAVAAYY